jgi:formylglycine-generating enzyme required for sulfatase activity
MRSFREFLVELKKRHVYRVAVVYGVVAWFVVQASSIVVPELSLPAWLTRAVIVTAILGFPLALVLAWAYDITPARTDADAATPAAARRWPRALVAGFLVLLLGLGVYARTALSGDDELRGAALYAELGALADAGRYADAFALAQRADDPAIPAALRAKFTDRLTVLSEPAGAAVTAYLFTPGAPADTTPIELGVTPLRGLAVARGDYRLRVAAEGHAPVERPLSSAAWRLRHGSAAEAEVHVDVRLLPASQVPAGMVHVPGGRYQLASRDLQSLTAPLEDYLIDRLEVTNAQYAEFVDADGYARHDYWSDHADAVLAGASDVRARLLDRTGMPGPREWTGQQPPAELREHPVTGVSWYEAAAYCRFRGGRLPTLFEWERAARDGERSFSQGIQLPWGYVGPRDPATDRANLAGSGTTRVGTYPFGLSAFGALDMAGNVKEWLYNRSESGRAVTGGSWADPIYVFSEVGSMDPAASAPMVGFRCARRLDGVAAAGQGDAPLRLTVTTPVYEPVDDATFNALLSHYHYDPRPLDAAVEERIEGAAWIRERIRYNGPSGDRVIAYLFLPKSGRPPYQTIVFVPSSAAFFGNHVGDLAEETLGPLVRAGRALFTVVMSGMTEREFPADWERPAPASVAFRDLMVRQATELRLGLDYLETRDDIDSGAIAYAASSFGAGSRLVFAGVDDRFRAVVLIGAGIDERIHPTLPEASNINFAPRIRAPKLVVNGLVDEEHPWLTRALPLWNLLREPKELALFEGVGHVPPPELRIPAIRDFLDRHLGAR